jgi:predicted acylesterase/phospholipase RssA
VEELPKEFRCVSVDLLARRAVVHRRGPLADVVCCSLRVPGLAGTEGPLIAVNIRSTGGGPRPPATTKQPRSLRVPSIGDTLNRALTIGSGMAAATVLGQADVAIQPDAGDVGFLEWHQIDRAREAGRIATREALPQIMALVQR